MFRKEYTKFMDNMLKERYATKVSQSGLALENGEVRYLPHHGVFHPRKKKLKDVFDCSAKYQGTSINDQLLQGPNLTNSLVGILIRFRQSEIGSMEDIDSMFLPSPSSVEG